MEILPRERTDVRDERRPEKVKQGLAQAVARTVLLGLSYGRRAQELIERSRSESRSWTSYKELDGVICKYFDHRFFSGGTVDEGSKVLAGSADFDPQLNKTVTTMLPRASRALRGWTKIGSAVQGCPLCWGSCCRSRLT